MFINALPDTKTEAVITANHSADVTNKTTGKYTTGNSKQRKIQQNKICPGSVASCDSRAGNEMSLFYNVPQPTWGISKLGCKLTEVVSRGSGLVRGGQWGEAPPQL